jgi:hypothetical protein
VRARGLVVRTDVGLSDFRIDLTVARAAAPDSPVLAVLLDGPAWARRRTVGDRDGLPVEVLTRLLSWPAVERVWLPAWLADRDAVVDRLVAAVEATTPPSPAGPGMRRPPRRPAGRPASSPAPLPRSPRATAPAARVGGNQASAAPTSGGIPVQGRPVRPGAQPVASVHARQTSSAATVAVPGGAGAAAPVAARPVAVHSGAGQALAAHPGTVQPADPPALRLVPTPPVLRLVTSAPIADIETTADAAPAQPSAAAPSTTAATTRVSRPARTTAKPAAARLDGERPFAAWTPKPAGEKKLLDSLADPKAARAVRRVLTAGVRAEGPVHYDRLVRIAAAAFGLTRVTAARRAALLALLSQDAVVGEFVWPADVDPATWRGFRRSAASSDRPLEHVAPEEIGNAMAALCRADGGLARDALHLRTLGVFGYRRRTPALLPLLDAALAGALADGRLTEQPTGLFTC